MSTVYTASTVIACTPAQAVAFMQDPDNQLRWSTFVRSTRPLGDGRHEMTTMFGDTVAYRIEADAARGIADLCMETPVGETCMPVRATAHSRGCFFTFGIVRPPAISDEDWARSCAGLDAELDCLRDVLESDLADPTARAA
jgi:hypothetical protein